VVELVARVAYLGFILSISYPEKESFLPEVFTQQLADPVVEL